MKPFFIVLLILVIPACVDRTNKDSTGLEVAYFHHELLAIKSPDGKRLLKLTEIGPDSTNCHTQVLIDFGRTASGVYAASGRNLGIKTYWKNNNTIVIETAKSYDSRQKWKQVQSFGDVVKVEYSEN